MFAIKNDAKVIDIFESPQIFKVKNASNPKI